MYFKTLVLLVIVVPFLCVTLISEQPYAADAPKKAPAAKSVVSDMPPPTLEAKLHKEEPKPKSDKDYGRMVLPSRLIGIGVSSVEKCKFEGMAKFAQIDLWEESRLSGNIAFGGWSVPLFVDYDRPNPQGPRKAVVMYGYWGQAFNMFWKKMSDLEITINGKTGFIDTRKDWAEKEDENTRRSTADLLAQGAAVKRETLQSRSMLESKCNEMVKENRKNNKKVKSPSKYDINAKAFRIPTGLLQSRGEPAYWNYAFCEPGAYFEVVLDRNWSYDYTSDDKSPRFLIGMVMPDPKALLQSFFRNCTVLQMNVMDGAGGESGPKLLAVQSTSYIPPVMLKNETSTGDTISFFDDNLNLQYGEIGKDSVMIGSSLSLVGSHISVGNRVFDLKVQQDKYTHKTSVELKPSTVKTGAIQLQYSGDYGMVEFCQIRQGTDYFSIVTKPIAADEKKKAGPIIYEPLVVPVGTYEVVGGLLSRKATKDEDPSAYACFVGGRAIKVTEGKVTKVTMGHPLPQGEFMPFKLDIRRDEKERRFVTMSYPQGLNGELYKEFFPRLGLPKLDITSKANKEIKIFYTFEYKNEGAVFMETSFRFDRAIMNPKNGPFLLDSDVETNIFRTQKIHVEVPNL